MNVIRALIAEDEPPARRRLRRFLEKDKRIEVVAEAGDGGEALRIIETLRPDLLFLDIQMPVLNGFEVLEALESHRPQVIFTTAYDQFAIQAFEIHALDYLLKPFDEARLRQAVDRAVNSLGRKIDSGLDIDRLVEEFRKRRPILRRILIRGSGRIAIVDTREISRVSSEEKYVQLFVQGRSFLHRDTLQRLEERLDPSLFVRVHRGQIVNMEYIRELELSSHGDYVIFLKDGTRIPLGRTYREHFLERFMEPPDASP
jgi:two-component system, LytTR family, response regulator